MSDAAISNRHDQFIFIAAAIRISSVLRKEKYLDSARGRLFCVKLFPFARTSGCLSVIAVSSFGALCLSKQLFHLCIDGCRNNGREIVCLVREASSPHGRYDI